MTRPRCSSAAARPVPDSGFTMVEMLVSITVMLIIVGSIFTLVDPTHGISRAQPEVSDMQQRMRVATDQMSKDLIMAGAGTYSGAIAGGLANFFAPIQPFRSGTLYYGESLQRYFPDRITIAYVPNTAAQTQIREPMPQPSSEVKVDARPGCPVGDELCGFDNGMRVIIFDNTGAFDFFTITEVQTDALHLQHRPPTNPADFSKRYTPDENARIAQCETHTYFRDPQTNQLMHYIGWGPEPEVVIDNVVDLRFQYFGDPNPPTDPRPQPGSSNCIFDAAGNPLMPVLSSNGSSLVELTEDILRTGPLCGAAPNVFDADLYRVKKVRVMVRIQAPDDLRGTDAFFFRNPGRGSSAYKYVPDYEMSFEISPRNMTLTR